MGLLRDWQKRWTFLHVGPLSMGLLRDVFTVLEFVVPAKVC
jgi:hypothetical protein